MALKVAYRLHFLVSLQEIFMSRWSSRVVLLLFVVALFCSHQLTVDAAGGGMSPEGKAAVKRAAAYLLQQKFSSREEGFCAYGVIEGRGDGKDDEGGFGFEAD